MNFFQIFNQLLYFLVFNNFTSPPSYSQPPLASSSGRNSNNNNNSNSNHSSLIALAGTNNCNGNSMHPSTSSTTSTTKALLNPRDLATVQLAAQQQAVYDAYANYHQQQHRQQQPHSLLPSINQHPQHHSNIHYNNTNLLNNRPNLHQPQHNQQRQTIYSTNSIDYSTTHH